MSKEMTFDKLRKLVIGIWLEKDSSIDLEGDEEDDDQGEYQFKDFLRGYCYGLPVSERAQYIEHEGGGEGGGSDCESVIQVDGVYYKVFYAYASYEGFYWDDAEVQVVQPVERMVTFYESI